MSDKRRIESAIQQGRVRAAEFWEEYRATESEEAAEILMQKLVESLPPGAHMILDQIDPVMHRRVMDKVQRSQDGKG